MRELLAFAALLAAPSAAGAHEFCLDLPNHRLPADEAVAEARFLVGDKGDNEPWRLVWEKIVALRSYGPGGAVDQQAGITPRAEGVAGGARVSLAEPGTHVIGFESHHADNDLPADEFEAYLVEDGLTPAIEARRSAGTTGERGREIYSRRAKALVQVGPTPSADGTRPIGHSLEIVPERNPYALAPGDPLPLRVYYHGRPLAGAKLLLADLAREREAPQVRTTDEAGRAAFPIRMAGRWRASVVWTRPIAHPRAEFETIFASLTFGY